MATEKQQGWTLTAPLEDERFAWLDTLADPVQKGWHAVFRAGPAGRTLKNLLNGVPWRHRVHPALIVVPLGAWTTAAALDALDVLASGDGNDGFARSADAAVAIGLVSAAPTVLAGWADWVDLYDHQRRVGMAHAITNITGIGLYGASLALRLAGARNAGRLTGALGLSAVTLGGVLGGEMVYNLGVNVSHLLYPRPPLELRDVLGSAELPEETPVVVEVERIPVMLYRRDGQAYAVQSWCPHAGGPLEKGEFEGCEVTCPWHQSRFDLGDGAPLNGPATVPLRTFEVREQGGRILVRPSYEAESWPPPPDPPHAGPVVVRS